jgi:hypothetical protein
LTSNVNYPDNPTTTNYPTSLDGPRRWSQDYGTRIHGWLYIENTNDYTFWLDADDTGELWLNNELIASGSSGYHQWDEAPQSSQIHLEAGNLYYIMVLQKQGADDEDHVGAAWSTSNDDTTAEIIPGKYLLPFEMYSRVWAYGPSPANGATDVLRDSILSWSPGKYAATHDIYFGTDFNDVNNANTSTAEIYKGRQSDITYIPVTLDFNATYYWRIDEVNDAHPDKLWKGQVWSFTTGNFLVVDDFESYNDVDNRIYLTWEDYAMNNTGMTVGHFVPPYAERSIVHNGSQSMYMRYDNDGTVNEGIVIEGVNYEQSGTLFYSEAQRQWSEPQDWTGEDVNSLTIWFRGVPASVGSFTPGPPIYTMTARGADIWDTSDQFHFAYKLLSGEGSIETKVISLTNTNNRAKAGVMIRQSLDADSAHTMVCFNPEGRVEFLQRSSKGDTSVEIGTAATGITTPVSVRLTRTGNTFTAEYSSTGNPPWTQLSSVDMPMMMDTYIGLIACSHDNNATCTAEFSNVITSGTGNWQSQDIGIQSNVAEQLYVLLQDSANNSAVVRHPDPAATTFSTWTEWNIPLTEFTGVNLQSIQKMTIGVGDRDNPQSGGSGDLYIDDIRLYRP